MSIYWHLTSAREEELIESIAKKIDDSEIRDFARGMLKIFGITDFFGTMGFVAVYPFVTALTGPKGQDVTELLGLNAVESSKRIIERVDELARERDGGGIVEVNRRPPKQVLPILKKKLKSIFSKK